jgi:hypothetical protein
MYDGAAMPPDLGRAGALTAWWGQDGVPDQWAQFTTENVRFFDQLRSPGGASNTGPLPYDTKHVSSYVTGRRRRRGQAHATQGAALKKR